MITALAMVGLESSMQALLDGLMHFNFPSREQFVAAVESVTALQAAALVAIGVIYLLFGIKIFKTLVILNAAVLGGMIGATIGERTNGENMPLFMGLAGAVLAGAVAWPLMRWAVGVMGALAGGLVGYAVWAVVAHILGNDTVLGFSWAGGLLGMVVVGMLTFIAVPNAVMIFTAVQGAVMVVTGLSALVLTHSGMGDNYRPQLVENQYMLTLLIGVPAVVGYTLQTAGGGPKGGKKPAPAGKPAS